MCSNSPVFVSTSGIICGVPSTGVFSGQTACPQFCVCAVFGPLVVAPFGINATTVGSAPTRTWVVSYIASLVGTDAPTEYGALFHP